MIPERDSTSLFGKPSVEKISPFKKLEPDKFVFAVEVVSPRISLKARNMSRTKRISRRIGSQDGNLLF